MAAADCLLATGRFLALVLIKCSNFVLKKALLDFTTQIAIESTQLPGEFHRDPADQIIVATARIQMELKKSRK